MVGRMKNREIGMVALVLGFLAIVFAGVPATAAADEVKTPITPMILNLTAPSPTQSYDSVFNEAMRAPGPRPRGIAALGGELQRDGSVKYGDVSMTIMNPCPQGTSHYEPPPLPGRRPRK
jgi:hypothetical protein